MMMVIGSKVICILKAKSKAKGITRNLITTIGDITDFILRGPFQRLVNYLLLPSHNTAEIPLQRCSIFFLDMPVIWTDINF